jgi:hypothetical protein
MTISQRSASLIPITHVVLDIGRNIPFFYGEEATSLELEFQSDNYLSIEIGGYTALPIS